MLGLPPLCRLLGTIVDIPSKHVEQQNWFELTPAAARGFDVHAREEGLSSLLEDTGQ